MNFNPLRIIPGPHPDEPAVVLTVPGSQLKPTSFPSRGSAYKDTTLASPVRRDEGWGDWKFGYWEETKSERPPFGEDNQIGFYFFKNIPSTPVQLEDIELELWGPAHRLSYRAFTTDALPARGDLFSMSSEVQTLELISGGSLEFYSGTGALSLHAQEYVYDAKEVNVVGGMCEVIVTTLPGNTITKVTDKLDPDTGASFAETVTWTLSATRPATAAAVDAYGNFTTVEPAGFNLWKTTTSKITTLPGPSVPRTWYDTERIRWPRVLKSNTTFSGNLTANTNPGIILFDIFSDSSETDVAKRIKAENMKEAYTGESRAKREEWWQLDPPSIPTPVELIEVGVSIRGVYSTIEIEPCLHAAIGYIEDNRAGNDGNFQKFYLQWVYAATNYTDWPGYITKLDVAPMGGGYRCRRTTIYSPPASASGGELSASFTRYR